MHVFRSVDKALRMISSGDEGRDYVERKEVLIGLVCVLTVISAFRKNIRRRGNAAHSDRIVRAYWLGTCALKASALTTDVVQLRLCLITTLLSVP